MPALTSVPRQFGRDVLDDGVAVAVLSRQRHQDVEVAAGGGSSASISLRSIMPSTIATVDICSMAIDEARDGMVYSDWGLGTVDWGLGD